MTSQPTTPLPAQSTRTQAAHDREDGALVSVVVPTRDRDHLLVRALESIAAQQVDGPLEILVVRDGTDPARLPLALPDGVVLRQVVNTRSPGLAGTRNTGIQAATGRYVAFCDDDDEWLPGKLAAQVALLQRDPGASLCATGMTVVHAGEEHPRRGPLRPTTLEDLLTRRVAALHPSSFLLRREDLLGAIGLVDERLPGGYAEDYDLLLRAAAVGPVLTVPRVLVRVHWHGGSYYFSRWQTISTSLDALVTKHPAFHDVPAGLARVRGQQALAQAAMGHRRDALALAAEALRLNPREPRGVLAVAAASGVLPVERLQGWLHRRGRGL